MTSIYYNISRFITPAPVRYAPGNDNVRALRSRTVFARFCVLYYRAEFILYNFEEEEKKNKKPIDISHRGRTAAAGRRRKVERVAG